jgi:hypothetical protein
LLEWYLSKDSLFAGCDPEMVDRCFTMAEAEWREIEKWADHEMAVMPDLEEGLSKFFGWCERPMPRRVH